MTWSVNPNAFNYNEQTDNGHAKKQTKQTKINKPKTKKVLKNKKKIIEGGKMLDHTHLF